MIGIHIETMEVVDIWHRIRYYNSKPSKYVCHNHVGTYEGRDIIEFSITLYSQLTVGYRTYSELLFLTGQLSDRERLCITDDEEILEGHPATRRRDDRR